MNLDSTRRAVFTTSELLENVLSYLPPQQLFSLQRVSQQWRGVIAGFPGLQEKMFLRQSATPIESWTLENYEYPRSLGSIGSIGSTILYRRHLRRVGMPRFRRSDGSKTMRGKLLSLTLNPIFSLADCSPMSYSGAMLYHNHRALVVTGMSAIERSCIAFSDHVSIRIRPGALRVDSSLRNVYFSDPPCRVVEAKLMVKFQGARPYVLNQLTDTGSGFRVEKDAGITIGDILTAALETAKLNCCEFDNGHLWKDTRTELMDLVNETEQPSGWTLGLGLRR